MSLWLCLVSIVIFIWIITLWFVNNDYKKTLKICKKIKSFKGRELG